MTYILRIGPWHVGPFDTHQGAQHWAERHGCDDYTMIPLDDPAEAPGDPSIGTIAHGAACYPLEPVTPRSALYRPVSA
jgi:hypothetical protein